MFPSLYRAVISFRLPLILFSNALVLVGGYFFSLALRFDFDMNVALDRPYLVPLLLLALYRTIAYGYLNLNQGYWRYSSTRDLLNIFKAHAASTAMLAATLMLLPGMMFPRSVLFIEFGLSILLSGGLRLVSRMFFERFIDGAGLPVLTPQDREVIVLGAGDSGHLLVKMLTAHRRLGYKPVAVLDDSEWMRGHSVIGVPIAGPIAELGALLQRYPHVSAVILAIPSYSKERFEAVNQLCKEAGVPLKRVQSFEDIACLDASQPREGITIESVLDREVKVEHEAEIHRALAGKRVLVTGAGGSIGSELVRQILQFGPAELILLDNSEFNLFKAGQEFSKIAPNTRKHFELATICDQTRMFSVFDRHRPQFVYHAAAYKHVPLLEENCYEAFRNNILGTRNVLSLCLSHGVERFVLISTDKAVDPVSVMGASKRIAEVLTQEACELARSSAQSPNFTAAAVRFGNVINSAGSVIPLFKEQIISGGPLTVTHPDMERFFMSIREAVRLVLTAGTLSDNGEVYVLDMGKPIKIVDVAKKMLALYGRRDIPIVFTGVRPGEKLSESLNTTSEVRAATRFNKVSRLVGGRTAGVSGFQWAEQFEARIAGVDDAAIAEAIRAFVASAAPVHAQSTRKAS